MASERLAVSPSSHVELVARFLGSRVGRLRNIDVGRLARILGVAPIGSPGHGIQKNRVGQLVVQFTTAHSQRALALLYSVTWSRGAAQEHLARGGTRAAPPRVGAAARHQNTRPPALHLYALGSKCRADAPQPTATRTMSRETDISTMEERAQSLRGQFQPLRSGNAHRRFVSQNFLQERVSVSAVQQGLDPAPLDSFLRKHSLKAGGRLSQFEAFSLALFSSKEKDTELRELSAEYLRLHPDEFQQRVLHGERCDLLAVCTIDV
eukprot:537755-Pleurochrysis_carterae.AAC.1